jgi:hypothetical protein
VLDNYQRCIQSCQSAIDFRSDHYWLSKLHVKALFRNGIRTPA